jgi:hypothetical protein
LDEQYIYIYRERERESEAMVLREVQNLPYFASVSRIWKFKRSIQTIEHDLHIELSLEIKFYFFLNFFTIFQMSTKSLVLDGAKIVRSANFVPNMKIMFNGLDRPFKLSNLRYGCEAREILYFAKHHSLTIYIYRHLIFIISSDFYTIFLKSCIHFYF